jgi:hypothetical protein
LNSDGEVVTGQLELVPGFDQDTFHGWDTALRGHCPRGSGDRGGEQGFFAGEFHGTDLQFFRSLRKRGEDYKFVIVGRRENGCGKPRNGLEGQGLGGKQRVWTDLGGFHTQEKNAQVIHRGISTYPQNAVDVWKNFCALRGAAAGGDG